MAVPFTDLQLINVWDMQGVIDEVNEVILGINERRAGSATTIADVDSGANIQSLAFWQNLQDIVIGLVTSGSSTTGFVRVPDYTFPREFVVTYQSSNISDFFADAGFTAKRLRRAIAYDPAVNDWTDAADAMWLDAAEANPNNRAQKGDILGPWLIEDLQKCLSVLTRYAISATAGSLADERSASGIGSNFATVAGAVAAARDNWENNESSGDAGIHGGFSSVFTTFENLNGTYSALASKGRDRRVAQVQLGPTPSGIRKGIATNGCEVDGLLKVAATGFSDDEKIFDAQGTDVVENQFVNLFSESILVADTGEYFISDYALYNTSAAPPNAPGAPADPDTPKALGFGQGQVSLPHTFLVFYDFCTNE